MNPLETLQAWMRDYEIVSTDIKLSRDAITGPNSFAYTMTGYIQPKCQCREITTVGALAKEFIRGDKPCLIHPDRT